MCALEFEYVTSLSNHPVPYRAPYRVTYLEAVARIFEFSAAQLQPRMMPLETDRDLVNGEGLAVVSQVGDAAGEVLIQHWAHLMQLVPLRRAKLRRRERVRDVANSSGPSSSSEGTPTIAASSGLMNAAVAASRT